MLFLQQHKETKNFYKRETHHHWENGYIALDQMHNFNRIGHCQKNPCYIFLRKFAYFIKSVYLVKVVTVNFMSSH